MNIILIILLLLCARAWAGEITLIENNPPPVKEAVSQKDIAMAEKTVPKEKETVDRDFEQMQEFMRQANERLKSIKILNLDLERADLELKKREIEEKIIGLNKDQNTAPIGLDSSTGLVKPMSFKVVGIFLNGNARQAIVSIDGRFIQVQEGQSIRQGVLVNKINADSVIFGYPDGKQETINFGA